MSMSFLVGVVDERRLADVPARRGALHDVERAVVVLRGDRFLALGVGRGGDVGHAVAGAEVGLLRVRLHVHAGAANPDGGGGRLELHRALGREDGEEPSGKQPQPAEDDRVGLRRLQDHAALAAHDEGALAHGVDQLGALARLQRRTPPIFVSTVAGFPSTITLPDSR